MICDFPRIIVNDLLSNWVAVADVACLDVAHSSKRSRERFLGKMRDVRVSLSRLSNLTIEECMRLSFASREKRKKLLQHLHSYICDSLASWLRTRNVLLSTGIFNFSLQQDEVLFNRAHFANNAIISVVGLTKNLVGFASSVRNMKACLGSLNIEIGDEYVGNFEYFDEFFVNRVDCLIVDLYTDSYFEKVYPLLRKEWKSLKLYGANFKYCSVSGVFECKDMHSTAELHLIQRLPRLKELRSADGIYSKLTLTTLAAMHGHTMTHLTCPTIELEAFSALHCLVSIELTSPSLISSNNCISAMFQRAARMQKIKVSRYFHFVRDGGADSSGCSLLLYHDTFYNFNAVFRDVLEKVAGAMQLHTLTLGGMDAGTHRAIFDRARWLLGDRLKHLVLDNTQFGAHEVFSDFIQSFAALEAFTYVATRIPYQTLQVNLLNLLLLYCGPSLQSITVGHCLDIPQFDHYFANLMIRKPQLTHLQITRMARKHGLLEHLPFVLDNPVLRYFCVDGDVVDLQRGALHFKVSDRIVAPDFTSELGQLFAYEHLREVVFQGLELSSYQLQFLTQVLNPLALEVLILNPCHFKPCYVDSATGKLFVPKLMPTMLEDAFVDGFRLDPYRYLCGAAHRGPYDWVEGALTKFTALKHLELPCATYRAADQCLSVVGMTASWLLTAQEALRYTMSVMNAVLTHRRIIRLTLYGACVPQDCMAIAKAPLQVLEIRTVPITDLQFTLLLRVAPNLHTLKIAGKNSLTDAMLKGILKELPLLRLFELMDCVSFSGAALIAFMDSSPQVNYAFAHMHVDRSAGGAVTYEQVIAHATETAAERKRLFPQRVRKLLLEKNS